jgi:chemotaxis protein methyltransferase CheR
MNAAEKREFVFTDKDFSFISDLVYKTTGIVLAAHKRDMVYSRLTRRLRALGMNDFAAYCSYIQGPAKNDEMGNLVNAITTNLTRFFREGHHFNHLEAELDKLLKNGQKRLRIWSAGCSTGAEPYSIACVLAQVLENNKNISGIDAKILATDIDTNMINQGRAGVYKASELQDIPKKYHKYASIEGEQMEMSDKLKELIIFNPLNLLEQWPMKGKFDIIFCRNVVIYFDKPTQRILFDRYAKMLNKGGWLYIGHSENLFDVCDKFALQEKTVYRLKD